MQLERRQRAFQCVSHRSITRPAQRNTNKCTILLECFTVVDQDQGGRVNHADFDNFVSSERYVVWIGVAVLAKDAVVLSAKGFKGDKFQIVYPTIEMN